jgi:hypothetical protein
VNHIFLERLIITLKTMGELFLMTLTIPLLIVFIALLVVYPILITIFGWLIGIVLVIVAVPLILISIYIWIDWQFIEPYKKWRKGKSL